MASSAPLLKGEDGLVVIGAGFGRTATSSLKIALEKVLDKEGCCYHMSEVFKNNHAGQWNDVFEGKKPAASAFKDMFGSTYRATVDFPASCMYKELMEAYPNAKVVLSVRPAESWYTSVRDTIWGDGSPEFHWIFRTSYAGRVFQKLGYNYRSRALLDGVDRDDKEGCIKSFNAWVEKVKNTVPPEKLLVFEAKDGWTPLCRFLGVPEPSEPFPNVNDTEEIKKNFAALRTFLMVRLVGSIALLGGAGYWVSSRFL
eukprot:TRINITY_DN26256_c0_g1_i1.p1 TRINITY_DN26256_c0_g1~~TRINITY_DN26256_c0_g1_i1.p1  ORF type:complete len:256 (+),score=54.52 TRINITY_DN26256_c0_g1_i1:47-814(+)